jgi:putative SOS response-associated peptidase YedK
MWTGMEPLPMARWANKHMCGRFTLRHTPEQLAAWLDRYGLRLELPDMRPRYNIAPTQAIATVTPGDRPDSARFEWKKWGLIPGWSIGPGKKPFQVINARAESVTEKPAFRNAFKKRRCLILADGFFEWVAAGKKKQPVWITLPSQEPFAFAGLWEPEKSPPDSGQRQTTTGTAAIITTAANPDIEAVHDRMPVILPPPAWNDWLHATEPARAESLLLPLPAGSLMLTPVNSVVNSARQDLPECIEPLATNQGS